MEKIPSGYCNTCYKQSLDKIDLETEARELVATLKRSLPVAGVMGGRDAALAEACFLLELPVPPDMQRQELTETTAKILMAELLRRFGNLVVNMIMNHSLSEKIYRYFKEREIEEREYRERIRRPRYDDYRLPPDVSKSLSPPIPEKFYYVPEYRVKENKRP